MFVLFLSENERRIHYSKPILLSHITQQLDEEVIHNDCFFIEIFYFVTDQEINSSIGFQCVHSTEKH